MPKKMTTFPMPTKNLGSGTMQLGSLSIKYLAILEQTIME